MEFLYAKSKFLNAHSGFKRSDLQGYLNLFALISNPPSDLLKKTEDEFQTLSEYYIVATLSNQLKRTTCLPRHTPSRSCSIARLISSNVYELEIAAFSFPETSQGSTSTISLYEDAREP